MDVGNNLLVPFFKLLSNPSQMLHRSAKLRN